MIVLTGAVQLAWPALIGARRAGVDLLELLDPLGLSWEDVRDPIRRIPYERLCRLWDRAAELSGDPSFGLGVVGAAPIGSMGVLEYLLRNSASLREKIAYYTRFQRLYQDASEVRLELDGGRAILWYWLPPGSPTSPALNEFALGCVIDFPRQLARNPALCPREVRFRHPAPADTSTHEKFFGCRLEFDCPTTAVVFDLECLVRLEFEADPRLRDVLEDHACRLMETLPPKSELLARAGAVIRAQLEREVAPPLDDVARRLGLGARTLRRRLAQEGTAFQELLDRQRCELALRYLEDPEITTARAAGRLGFSDPKSFTRAFRRWTGMSPRAYRTRTAQI